VIHDRVDVEWCRSLFPIEHLRDQVRAEYLRSNEGRLPESDLRKRLERLQPWPTGRSGVRDVAVVEQLAERRAVVIPPEQRVPTDLFMFSLGEAPRRELTKVGGVPYWPADRPWPTTSSGVPLTFVAQFNFLDSLDLTGPLPGALLLVFADGVRADEGDWYDDPPFLQFHWMQISAMPLIAARAVPEPAWRFKPCYGSIYRIYDWKIPEDAAERGIEVEPGVIDVLSGTKIGGVPDWIQDRWYDEGRFLCQLGSIWVWPHEPYPFLNVPEPYQHSVDDTMMWGDVGALYIFHSPEKGIYWGIDCH
jgi:hypothetical protein